MQDGSGGQGTQVVVEAGGGEQIGDVEKGEDVEEQFVGQLF